MKILFCDVDGTLTETIPGKPFKQNSQDIKIIDGVEEVLSHYARKDWLIIGISNQGGVAAGHKKLLATVEEMANTLNLLPQLTKIYFCADFEGKELYFVASDDCDAVVLPPDFISCRKPSPGMIKHVFNHIVDPISEAWMVGDRTEDEECAQNAGINFCPADAWRDRFRKGIFTHKITPAQLQFLEGVAAKGGSR